MRPIAPRLMAIDMRKDLDHRPRMILAFPGAPARWISVRIAGAETENTKRWAKVLADQQLAVFTREQCQALFEVAKDGPIVHAVIGVGLTNAVRQLEGDPLEPFETGPLVQRL